MQAKVVVILVVDNKAIWRSEAQIQPKYARRMSSDELQDIGKNTAEIVEDAMALNKSKPQITAEIPEKKRKR